MGVLRAPRFGPRRPRAIGGLDLTRSLTSPEARRRAAQYRLELASRAYARADDATATYHAGRGLEILGLKAGENPLEELRRAVA